jgi:hypothetical protein
MKKFLLTFPTQPEAKCIIAYQRKLLKSIEFEGDFEDGQKAWLLCNTPLKASSFGESFSNAAKFRYAEIAEDASFKAFWELFAYKVGNKSKVERLWNAMSEAEKSQALLKIPKYKYSLAQSNNREQAYPETWLNQRRWENEH